MAGVLVLAFAWTVADRAWQAGVPSLYTRLAERGWWLLVIAAVFLAAMSVVGDLVESLIKRAPASRIPATCCRATAACSIGWTRCFPPCRWP